jgi:C4-dicarboxylate-specific signal transduction histidine kinase
VIEVVHAVGLALADQLAAADVELTVEPPPPALDTRAVIAEDDLATVLENLLTNALRALASHPVRRIRVAVSAEQRRLRLHVSDSGPGIPLELRERLFLPGVSTRPGSGGYGLWRAREILAHYGGSIRLEPVRPGQGAVFTLALRSLSSRAG